MWKLSTYAIPILTLSCTSASICPLYQVAYILLG